MKTTAALLVAIVLAGCTSQHSGKATGAPFALNQGQWLATQADLNVRGD